MTDEELKNRHLPSYTLGYEKLTFNGRNIPWEDITNCELETKGSPWSQHVFMWIAAVVTWALVEAAGYPFPGIILLLGVFAGYFYVTTRRTILLKIMSGAGVIASHSTFFMFGSSSDNYTKVERMYRELYAAILERSKYGSR